VALVAVQQPWTGTLFMYWGPFAVRRRQSGPIQASSPSIPPPPGCQCQARSTLIELSSILLLKNLRTAGAGKRSRLVGPPREPRRVLNPLV
jgi:hypothetical protein